MPPGLHLGANTPGGSAARPSGGRAPSRREPEMTGPRPTPLVASLPASVPFVGPETQERAKRPPLPRPHRRQRKRLRPLAQGHRRDAGRSHGGLEIRRPREPRPSRRPRRPPRRRPRKHRGGRRHRRASGLSRPHVRRPRRPGRHVSRRLSDLQLPRRGLRRDAPHRSLQGRRRGPRGASRQGAGNAGETRLPRQSRQPDGQLAPRRHRRRDHRAGPRRHAPDPRRGLYRPRARGHVAPIDAGDPRVIRMRTFSKGYGMAGLRVGYAIGHPSLIRSFDKVRNHFGIGRIAQAGALAALADQAWLAKVARRSPPPATASRASPIRTASPPCPPPRTSSPWTAAGTAPSRRRCSTGSWRAASSCGCPSSRRRTAASASPAGRTPISTSWPRRCPRRWPKPRPWRHAEVTCLPAREVRQERSEPFTGVT
jgi:histidinol-phosphate aminotransferase